MDFSKDTKYQTIIKKRNADIYADYEQMIADGFMKTAAYKALAEKYGLTSTMAVYNIIKRKKDGTK